MPDDLKDINNLKVFRLKHQWASSVRTTTTYLRNIINMRGCADVVQSKGEVAPLGILMEFVLKNRTEKNYLMDFIDEHRGRLNRFWLPHDTISFSLTEDVDADALVLPMKANNYDWTFQGYERFFIEVPNGDLITRKVASVVEDTINNRLLLNFDTKIDVPVKKNYKVGRLLLVRFDQDEFSLKHITSEVAETSIRFAELIHEYGELL